jgi:hypothetical protein
MKSVSSSGGVHICVVRTLIFGKNLSSLAFQRINKFLARKISILGFKIKEN